MILKLEPILFDKIWGGNKLKDDYNYNASKTCGEAWGISAHKNGSNKVINGIYKGKTIKELFDTKKELFGNYPGSEFPILVKVIDALENLSIQVHPNNEYAKESNSLGKEECWYILDTEENTNIIIGNTANNKKEIINAINNNSIENIINELPIKKGDFFYIKAGTVHAINGGTTLLEVQQSSDITYRLYDYNRLQDGKPRDLHLEDALNVITVPDKEVIREHVDTYFNYEIVNNTEKTNYPSAVYGDYEIGRASCRERVCLYV